MDLAHNGTSHVMSFLAVVNQLHRLVTNVPAGTLPQGMTISQLATIAFLYFRPDQETFQKDIEVCFKLRRSTVSSLLNTLERKGLIQRVSVPRDARLKKLILTKDAVNIGAYVQKAFADMDALMFRGVSAEELAALDTILDKVQQNLHDLETPSPGGTL
ncbi:MAG: MarR family transcriptional regulator [Ruminiclostridium sp.]|nr:MarR family transcriptional regulator [Ruminiclostridium sp.]